ncbi:MAG: hypothetical protein LC624_02405 [Halobacteriales archaeon]|nr:hypothetical protein [Halobacteriales archaeon]
MARRRAVQLALVGGVLLLLAHASAGTSLLQLGDRLARAFLPAEVAPVASLAFLVLFVIASLGGLGVIFGAVAWRKGWMRTGHLFVMLGAGTGLLGLLLLLVVSVASGSVGNFLLWLLGPAGLGVALCILARREAG